MSTNLCELIDVTVAAIEAHVDELTELDQAIGDGDHGINMKRGFEAIKEAREELIDLPLGGAVQKAGMLLVMKVGGASGPLYGSLLMSFGKALAENSDTANLSRAFREGVDAVKRRGKSDVGQKTMLDVLVPVSEALARALQQGVTGPELASRIRLVADQGLEATRQMEAKKGRASFLGERSIGHLDPGARSSCLLVNSVCNWLGETQ